MTNINYQIKDFMYQRLGLSGAELNIYAIIYSFSQNDGEGYYGSQNTLALLTGKSVSTVKRALSSLLEKGLIKKEKTGNRCIYTTGVTRDEEKPDDYEEYPSQLLLPPEEIFENDLTLTSELICKPARARWTFLPVGRRGVLSMTAEQYNALLALIDEQTLTAYINKLEYAVLNKGFRVKNTYQTIRKWILKDIRV